MTTFWEKWALRSEHEVVHRLGDRCRHCGHINESFDDQERRFNEEMREKGELKDGEGCYTLTVWSCDGCGLHIPAPGMATRPDEDPFEEALLHFEPLRWMESL